MQNNEAVASLQTLIHHHTQIVKTLQAALDLLLPATPDSVVQQKALPAPARKRRSKVVVEADARFTQEIDGVSFACTEQQHAFVEMLGANEYVPGPMAFPLYNNIKGAFQNGVADLRRRMVEAGVKAQIVGYKKHGYRLEVIEAGD